MANQGKNIEIEKSVLITKYLKEEKSMAIIAKELNVSTPTIHKNLKKYGINRSMSDAQKLKIKREGVHNQFELDIDLLKKLYLEIGLTSYEIAEKLNCSQYKVWKTLKKLNINKSVSDISKGRIPWNKNKPMLEETKNKIKESVKDRIPFWLGKIRCDDDKIKMRLSAINRINNTLKIGGQILPNYNKKSIKILEKYADENGYKIQHAENGGEYFIKDLGYWVDGYDINKNIVIEFDEKHHNKLKQKEKDIYRQNKIINHLNCVFIRIDENGKEKIKIDNYGK